MIGPKIEKNSLEGFDWVIKTLRDTPYYDIISEMEM